MRSKWEIDRNKQKILPPFGFVFNAEESIKWNNQSNRIISKDIGYRTKYKNIKLSSTLTQTFLDDYELNEWYVREDREENEL